MCKEKTRAGQKILIGFFSPENNNFGSHEVTQLKTMGSTFSMKNQLTLKMIMELRK